jgi:hypothetical protein
VDEARHAVLFQRFFDEVVGLRAESLAASLEAIRPDVTSGDWLPPESIFPAFRDGFTNVTRDESRHVQFGVLFLRDAIARAPASAAAIEETVLASLPAVLATLEPPDGDDAY